MLTRALAILAAIGGALAVFFGIRNRQLRAKVRSCLLRADSADASAQIHRRVDEAQEDVQQRHRKEQLIIEQGFKEGVRDHLDNHGSSASMHPPHTGRPDHKG